MRCRAAHLPHCSYNPRIDWTPHLDTTLKEPRATVLIPGARVRYLAEIAEQGRGINAGIDKQAEAADRAQSYWQSLHDLDDAKLPKALDLYDVDDVLLPSAATADFPACDERRSGQPDRRKVKFNWELRRESEERASVTSAAPSQPRSVAAHAAPALQRCGQVALAPTRSSCCANGPRA